MLGGSTSIGWADRLVYGALLGGVNEHCGLKVSSVLKKCTNGHLPYSAFSSDRLMVAIATFLWVSRQVISARSLKVNSPQDIL